MHTNECRRRRKRKMKKNMYRYINNIKILIISGKCLITISPSHIKYSLSWIIMKQFKKPFWSHLKYNVILIMMFLNQSLADSGCFMSNISKGIKLLTNTTKQSVIHELWAHVHMLWSDCDLIAITVTHIQQRPSHLELGGPPGYIFNPDIPVGLPNAGNDLRCVSV